jgi:hypothetical protein
MTIAQIERVIIEIKLAMASTTNPVELRNLSATLREYRAMLEQ